MSVSDSCTLLRSVEERRSLSGKSSISWLYLCTVPIVSLEQNNISEKERPIDVCSTLQPVLMYEWREMRNVERAEELKSDHQI